MKASPLLLLSSSSLLILAAGAVVACGSRGDDTPKTNGDNEIIGGVDAKSASLDAVGALMYRDPQTQQLQELCTATLIGERAVLSAKHCAVQLGQTAADAGVPAQPTETRFIDAWQMFFAIGPDTKAPKRLVPLESVSLCSDYDGGWIGMGCDFSVYRTKEAVTDVKPLKVAPATLAADAVGKKLTAVGYGAQNVAETQLGTRKAGTLTLRAVEGQPLHVLFPTIDAFDDAIKKDEGNALVLNSTEAIRQIYDMQLKPGYEVFLGAVDGDAQVCHGDSGGPLLMNVDGELVIQGVASAVGLSGARLPCNMGAIYAVPGPAAQKLVDEALHDPCDGVPANGRCEGDVAVRCTNADEGPRRVTRTDCAGLAAHCVEPDGGVVACE